MESGAGDGAADVNATGRDGWRAFDVAVYLGRSSAAIFLLNFGADPGLPFGSDLQTSWHASCYQGSGPFWTKRRCINNGIDARDANGRTALEYCAHFSRAPGLFCMLEVGADPCVNENKSLYYALCRNNSFCVRILLEFGGFLPERVFYEQILDNPAKAPVNRKAILLAIQNGFPECALSLLPASRKIGLPSWRGVIRSRFVPEQQ